MSLGFPTALVGFDGERPASPRAVTSACSPSCGASRSRTRSVHVILAERTTFVSRR